MAGLNVSLPGLSLPGLSSLPGFSSSAASSLNSAGATFNGAGRGDWNVNLGGSGYALQSASGTPMWLWIAIAVGAVWLLKK